MNEGVFEGYMEGGLNEFKKILKSSPDIQNWVDIFL